MPHITSAALIHGRSPSWGAWIETPRSIVIFLYIGVAPPRGERGLKHWRVQTIDTDDAPVAPPRGERGLKRLAQIRARYTADVAPPRGERGLKLSWSSYYPPCKSRSPSWGAWIETLVAVRASRLSSCRSPSWGAWIETTRGSGRQGRPLCRSPSWGAWIETGQPAMNLQTKGESLPLVGSVD